MFDCIIVVILRNIEIVVVPLYELGGWGWSGVLGSCDHGFVVHVYCDFLGYLFDRCFGLVCGCA